MNISIENIQTSVSIRNGNGIPLLIVPGNSLSKDCFQGLSSNPRLKDRCLIYYDFPGTGGSSRPPDPESGYGILAYKNHLQTLIKKLDLKECGLLGISLGGHVALRAAFDPCVTELHMIGVPPIAHVSDIPSAFRIDPDSPSMFQEFISPEEASALAREFTDDTGTHSLMINSILNADSDARKWLLENFTRTELDNEIQILKQLAIPWTLYYGRKDTAVSFEYIKALPEDVRDHIIYLAGEKHLPDWSRFEIR